MKSRKIKILAASALATLVIYFALANFYKTYSSEVEILILPQNEKTAVMYKEVLGNAAKIPLTVSFFDNLTADTIMIENPVEGQSAAERKAYWNSKLDAKILKNSGIVRFTGKDIALDQAESIAMASATSDILSLSSYYNIRDDVQMRIIEGPITSQAIGYSTLKVIAISLIFGIILSIIISLMIPFAQNRISSRDESYYVKPLPDETFAIKKDVSKESKIVEISQTEEIYPIISKKEDLVAKKEEIVKSETFQTKTPEVLSYEKKATAPGNLPIADNSIVSMFGATKNGTGYKLPKNISESEQKEEKPAVYREATSEEVKERLNRLLGGK